MNLKEAGIAFIGFIFVATALVCFWGVGYVTLAVIDLILGVFV